MNENLANEIRKTIESIKDMKTQASGINNYLSILEGLLRTDIQKKVEDAYKRGLEEGKKATFGLVADASNAEYQRGLDDAWEAARKIVLSPDEGGTSLPDLFAMFGKGSMQSVFRSYSASEAIAKLKGYEEKQKADNKIKVSDEVVWTEDENVVIVVTCVYTENNMEWCDGFCQDGKVYQILTEHARKTGRHFDIDKILEEMRHD